MKIEAVVRAAQILRSQPAGAMPLRTLHARLRDELGSGAGSYAQIYLQLKKRPQSFVMIDAPQLLSGAETWPAQVREEYHSALEGAGLGACVRVALAEPFADAQPGAVTLANVTIGELLQLAPDDELLRDCLTRAARQIEEISCALLGDAAAHPTTPPPDPPQ